MDTRWEVEINPRKDDVRAIVRNMRSSPSWPWSENSCKKDEFVFSTCSIVECL